MATNPAHAVRGPKHVAKTGKTTVLTGEQARELLDSIDTSTPRSFRTERLQVRRREARKRAQLWLILGDGVNQAADLVSGATSIPSRNLTPLMTFGN